MFRYKVSCLVLLDTGNNMFFLVLAALFLVVVLVAVFWGNWEKYTPKGFLFFCAALLLCMPIGVGSALHSTFPSLAPRVQATGILAATVKHGNGKSSYYTCRLLLDDGAERGFREEATVPYFAVGQKVIITYLDEKKVNQYPREIAIHVLSGPRAGWQDSVSADWFGPWWGIPFSIVAGVVLLVLAGRNLRVQAKEPASSEEGEITSHGIGG